MPHQCLWLPGLVLEGLGFKTHLSYLLALKPSTSPFTSLRLDFLINKMETNLSTS